MQKQVVVTNRMMPVTGFLVPDFGILFDKVASHSCTDSLYSAFKRAITHLRCRVVGLGFERRVR